MNTEDEIKKLKIQVQDLLDWKRERTRNQISYPLDKESKDILTRDFFRFNKELIFTSSSGQVFPYYIFNVNGKEALLSVQYNFYRFSANATTDVITSQGHHLSDGNQVMLLTTDTLPAPLTDIVSYYVINATANTFKLSLTFGGAAIDITDAGTGDHYALFFT